MELFVESNNKIYDLTGLCTELTWTDSLNDGAGSLEFSYIADDAVKIDNGSIVRLTTNDQTKGIFYGYVFRISMSDNKVVNIKAYDCLRYCKTKDTIVVEGDTLNSLVLKMCSFFGFNIGEIKDTGYTLADNVHTDKTWLDIIYTAISDTLIATEHYYCIRDECGTVCLRDCEDLQMPLVIGDKSMCTEYSYDKSIDDDFYNRIKLVSSNESTGHADVYITYDSESVDKYGLLQYYEVLGENSDKEKAKDKAEKLLKLYNRECEELTLTCLGDIDVRAGCMIYGDIKDIELNRCLIIQKATHTFIPVHTMSLEVMLA